MTDNFILIVYIFPDAIIEPHLDESEDRYEDIDQPMQSSNEVGVDVVKDDVLDQDDIELRNIEPAQGQIEPHHTEQVDIDTTKGVHVTPNSSNYDLESK